MELTTLDKIKRISLRLFNERSYEGTSLKDIFNEIGISAPSFYYYYASKKDLYIELMNTIQKEHGKYVLEQFEKAEKQTTQQTMYELLKAFVSYGIENQQEANFIFKGVTFPNYEFMNDLKESSYQWQNQYRNIALDIIRKGQENGEISADIDEMVILNTYFNMLMCIGCNMVCYIEMKAADDIQPYFDLFYRGISS